MDEHIEDSLVPDVQEDGYKDSTPQPVKRVSWWRRLWNWIKSLFG